MPVDGPPEVVESRAAVLVVLPRADHLRAYRTLVAALASIPQLETVVATSASSGLPDLARPASATYVTCPLYQEAPNASALRWLQFLLRRERTARHLIRQVAPQVLVVPSDVSDAILPFVEGARRRGTRVVYVQGTEVFANYPELNARAEAEQWRGWPWRTRILLKGARIFLEATGVHTAVGRKGVLGSRSDRVLVMNDTQREVHRRAGISADRLAVTGAPFLDEIVRLKRQFDNDACVRLRRSLGIADEPIVLFLTKSLFRLGWTDRLSHNRVIQGVLSAVYCELPEWICVVKLHPTEQVEDYRSLIDASNSRVRVVKEHPVEELLLSSELAISLGTSSPALAARLLGTPLLLVNFTGTTMLDAHGDLVAAVPTLRSADELRATLREIHSNPAARERLRGRTPADDRWMDGKASERIVAQIRDLVGLA